VEKFDFDLRVGMHGSDDRLLILALHDNMITQMNHFATP
jgi:hypothetical protein